MFALARTGSSYSLVEGASKHAGRLLAQVLYNFQLQLHCIVNLDHFYVAGCRLIPNLSFELWMGIGIYVSNVTTSNICSSAQTRYGVTCSVVQRELYVMGGGGGGNFHVPTPEVYKFDPVKNEWTEAAAMETARCYIVSGALNGRLYAVGGMGVTSSALRSWEVFNPQTNERLFREDPNVVPDLGESLVMDGKIYVRHASARSGYMGSYAAVFDPVESSWAAVDNEMVKKWCGPTAVTGNDVYMLDQSFGIKLMVLDKESGEWDRIGRFSPLSIRLPCRLAAIEKNLYVVGRGLKTLVLNTDKASTTSGGILVASTINGLPDSEDVILSCHVIEL
uniref:Uncharacterized protein n=1 Tax=Physcomitrium patens TaxID=3218 RepID=A0A7I4A5U7_PHYPA